MLPGQSKHNVLVAGSNMQGAQACTHHSDAMPSTPGTVTVTVTLSGEPQCKDLVWYNVPGIVGRPLKVDGPHG